MKKIFILIFILFILVGCKKDLPKLDKPLNIFIEDNIINFSKVENASHYVLSINGSLTTITDTTYELSEPGIYVIKVKSQGKNYSDSGFTDEITHYILGENPNLKFVYNLHSAIDLVIYDLSLNNPSITLSDVNQEYLEYSNNTIKVNNDYLKTLNVGKHNYILTINDVPFGIEIEVIDNENPYLMICSNYYFNPSIDIVIRFDTLGSTLQKVTGENLETTNYTLNNNELTINKEFIKEYFEEHSEYNLYVLTFEFKKDNQTLLSKVWIHKNIVL